jgi:hypothetical protein
MCQDSYILAHSVRILAHLCWLRPYRTHTGAIIAGLSVQDATEYANSIWEKFRSSNTIPEDAARELSRAEWLGNSRTFVLQISSTLASDHGWMRHNLSRTRPQMARKSRTDLRTIIWRLLTRSRHAL